MSLLNDNSDNVSLHLVKLHEMMRLVFGDDIKTGQHYERIVISIPQDLDPEVVERFHAVAYSLEPFFNALGYHWFDTSTESKFSFVLKRVQ